MVREIQDLGASDHLLVQLRESGGYMPPPSSAPRRSPKFEGLIKQDSKRRADEAKKRRQRKLAKRKAKRP